MGKLVDRCWKPKRRYVYFMTWNYDDIWGYFFDSLKNITVNPITICNGVDELVFKKSKWLTIIQDIPLSLSFLSPQRCLHYLNYYFYYIFSFSPLFSSPAFLFFVFLLLIWVISISYFSSSSRSLCYPHFRLSFLWISLFPHLRNTFLFSKKILFPYYTGI